MGPTLSSSYKGYLAALGHLAHAPGAAASEADILDVRGRLLRLEPNFTLATARARSPLRRQQDMEIYIEGLRRGGVREA